MRWRQDWYKNGSSSWYDHSREHVEFKDQLFRIYLYPFSWDIVVTQDRFAMLCRKASRNPHVSLTFMSKAITFRSALEILFEKLEMRG